MLSPVLVSTSEPPATITLQSLSDLVQASVKSGQVPDFRGSDQLLYLILTPAAYDFFDPNANGYHYFDFVDDHYLKYAWLGWNPLWTWFASHEIVEACTDPLTNGFYTGPNGIEVAD